MSIFKPMIVVLAALLFYAGPAARADDVRLQGGGSTFVAPMNQRWMVEYQKLHPDIKIDYQSIGSGGGIKGITDKTFDFAGSDAPLNKKQIAALGGEDKIVEIPTVAGAVVMAYNLPDFKGDLKLDGPTIAAIYLGKIQNWNDPAIAALNPGANLPNLPITPVHRTDGSGTTYIFDNYLATQSDDFKETVGTGTQVEWPGGQGGKGNAGVTQVVETSKGGVGYIELAYAIQNKLPFAILKNKDGNFVKATPEAVAIAGESNAREMAGGVLATPLWNQSGKDVYPIAAYTYMIIYRDLNNIKSKEQAQALVDFLRWSTTDGQKYAADLEFAPLNPAVQKKVGEALKLVNYKGNSLAAN